MVEIPLLILNPLFLLLQSEGKENGRREWEETMGGDTKRDEKVKRTRADHGVLGPQLRGQGSTRLHNERADHGVLGPQSLLKEDKAP